jgi:WD40 repeat protein
MAGRKKLRTMEGGSRAGLSRDGRLLAKEGKDGSSVDLCEVASGKLVRSIPRAFKRAENSIQALVFSPDGTLLDVAANAEDDEVYGVSSGKLLATLKDTKHAQFSKDGTLLIGASRQHLLVWSTKRWTKVRDLPNGPDDVTQIAAFPEGDFVVIGGLASARLLRLSAGQEFATVGAGYTSFAAFNPSGQAILTYTNSGFGVWDATGRRYCARPDLGAGAVALSPDGRWLAAAPRSGGTAVAVWNAQNALAACGAPAKQ